MREHIDWLTFTFTPVYLQGYDHVPAEAKFENALVDGLVSVFDHDLTSIVFGGIWKARGAARAPYSHAWNIDDGSITIFANPALNHACVEISGKGCERLISRNVILTLLSAVKSRVTRIDLAIDIKTEITPTEFVSAIVGKRMRSSGFQKSESGETCYVGSQKSERYARVYRYVPPHPRADLLRIEHVFRRDVARLFAGHYASGNTQPLLAEIGRQFGWAHPIWQVGEVGDVSLRIVNAERGGGKTVLWLMRSCAPAFRRLVQDGTIVDGEKFLREFFLLENENMLD